MTTRSSHYEMARRKHIADACGRNLCFRAVTVKAERRLLFTRAHDCGDTRQQKRQTSHLIELFIIFPRSDMLTYTLSGDF